ncbi:MAG: hypothetical protein WCA00_20410, partial [Candidatus Acidiferrales bacterium]
MKKCEIIFSRRQPDLCRKISFRGLLPVLALLAALLAIPTYGQDASPQTTDEKIQELMKQVQALQA